MKQRWRLFLALALLVFLGSSLFLPSVHWRLIGWAKGEAFFQGTPTSWWAAEIQESYYLGGLPNHHRCWVRFRSPSNLDRLHYAWNGRPDSDWVEPSPLVFGGPDALPVLLELVRHLDAQVRRVAVFGLSTQRSVDPAILSAIEAVMQDVDEDVRKAASYALATHIKLLQRERERESALRGD